MPAERVSNNRAQNAAHIRVQNVPEGQVRDMLRLQCIGHVVPFRWIFPVVEDRAHVGAARGIGYPKGGATFEHMGPGCAGLDYFFKQAPSFLLCDEVPRPE